MNIRYEVKAQNEGAKSEVPAGDVAHTMAKAELLRKLIMNLDVTEKPIIDIVPGHQWGILNRFAVSAMAVLLDCFELDDLRLIRKAIQLERRLSFD
uniref:Helix-turn-helix domain-containing protein n=1 Tax=Panagrellus redivivus TaxID=6233 RepID=A0A7E4W0D2_PANRE